MRKIITLLLVTVMAASVVACGKKEEKPATDKGQQTQNVEETDVAEEATAEETTVADSELADGTVGSILLAEFKANAEGTAQEIADALIANSIIQFPGATMPVEPGLLTGFDNAEITGFSEGVMFSPMMGTIPFVGYIFVLEDGTDVEEFKQTLKDNANLRWNICTEAEELIVENEGGKVFFLMSPKTFEDVE